MAGESHTVLVVEDDASLRLLCKVNLELEGYRVLEAGTLADARAALEGEAVGVVLLDMRVGEEDGLDLLQELHGGGRHVPIVLFTGAAEIPGNARALADALLRKPFSLDELSGTVGRLAGGSS